MVLRSSYASHRTDRAGIGGNTSGQERGNFLFLVNEIRGADWSAAIFELIGARVDRRRNRRPEMGWRDLETFSFGDSPELADELAALVLSGRKVATCWAASDGQSTEIGKRMVMLDGRGRPRAVLETVELNLRRFDEVDAAFAHDEGEDDRSLESWRRAHRAYFGRRGQFAEDMLLWCERFRLVERIVVESEACRLT